MSENLNGLCNMVWNQITGNLGKNEIEWTKSSMNLNGLCNMGEIVCNFGIEWWF